MKLEDFATMIGLKLENHIPPFSGEAYGNIQNVGGDESHVPEYLKTGELERGIVYLEQFSDGVCMALIGIGDGHIKALVAEFTEMALDVSGETDPREELLPCLSDDPVQSIKNIIEAFKAIPEPKPLYC